MKQILRKTIINILSNKSIENFYYGFVIDQQRAVMTQAEIETYNGKK